MDKFNECKMEIGAEEVGDDTSSEIGARELIAQARAMAALNRWVESMERTLEAKA